MKTAVLGFLLLFNISAFASSTSEQYECEMDIERTFNLFGRQVDHKVVYYETKEGKTEIVATLSLKYKKDGTRKINLRKLERFEKKIKKKCSNY